MIGRFAICFANPNHAAAMICALLPLCWRWRRCAWLGWIVLAAFCMMLALTQSRTGALLMAIEIAVLKCKVENAKCRIAEWFVFFVAVAVAAFLAVLYKLLVIVRAVNVQPSLVVECRGVGAEYARADGVAIAHIFIVGCYALGIQLQARSPDGCCQKHFLIHG